MRDFKENAMMQEINLQEMEEVNGGMVTLNFIFVDHIHCIQPEPGTCSCSPDDSFARHERI